MFAVSTVFVQLQFVLSNMGVLYIFPCQFPSIIPSFVLAPAHFHATLLQRTHSLN